eukprot:4912664-Prymnesium_polylepis.1
MRGEAAGYAFKTTMPRIAEQSRPQTAPEIGPGSYDTSKMNNGLNSQLADSAGETNAGASAFKSGSKQGI